MANEICVKCKKGLLQPHSIEGFLICSHCKKTSKGPDFKGEEVTLDVHSMLIKPTATIKPLKKPEVQLLCEECQDWIDLINVQVFQVGEEKAFICKICNKICNLAQLVKQTRTKDDE